MAERMTGDIFRRRLKELFGERNRLYSYLARIAAHDVVYFRDDFTGPVIDANKWTVGNGAGASAVSPAITVGAQGGQIRLTTGTAGDNTASSVLAGGRHLTGDTNAFIVARLKINTAVTSIKVEVGLRDSILTTAGNGKVVNVQATPSFVSTDGVAWSYDTSQASTGWRGLGVANTTAATTDTGYDGVPVADTFEYLMVELRDGAAFFSRYDADGVRTYFGGAGRGLPMLLAVTATVLLSPHIYVEARSGTSRNVDVDMVAFGAARSATP